MEMALIMRGAPIHEPASSPMPPKVSARMIGMS